MDNTVTIAAIAAFASLLVAIVSLITAIISNRNNARTLLSIEKLKNEFAQSGRNLDIIDSETKTSLACLKSSLESIQQLRDEIQFLAIMSEDSLQASDYKRIRDTANLIAQHYETNHPVLSSVEMSSLHKAKNLALGVKAEVEVILRRKESFKRIDLESFQRLDEIEAELSLIQRILWDCRAERLLNLGSPN